MVVIGEFLCGCNPSDKKQYLNTTQPDGTQQNIRRDADGYQVCPEHGERFYGWRSHDPKLPHYVSNGVGLPPSFISPDKVVNWVTPSGEDKRDNRDPENVYAEMKAGSNGHG